MRANALSQQGRQLKPAHNLKITRRAAGKDPLGVCTLANFKQATAGREGRVGTNGRPLQFRTTIRPQRQTVDLSDRR